MRWTLTSCHPGKVIHLLFARKNPLEKLFSSAAKTQGVFLSHSFVGAFFLKCIQILNKSQKHKIKGWDFATPREWIFDQSDKKTQRKFDIVVLGQFHTFDCDVFKEKFTFGDFWKLLLALLFPISPIPCDVSRSSGSTASPLEPKTTTTKTIHHHHVNRCHHIHRHPGAFSNPNQSHRSSYWLHIVELPATQQWTENWKVFGRRGALYRLLQKILLLRNQSFRCLMKHVFCANRWCKL